MVNGSQDIIWKNTEKTKPPTDYTIYLLQLQKNHP